jgi:hypothetical protein
MKKLIQLLEANIKLNSHGCPNIVVDNDISLNLVNELLLKDICTAAKNSGVNISITSAVSDHPEKTDSGAISRHSNGFAVDISKINGKSVKDASVKTSADNFVSQLEQLGYKRNSEGSNTKSVLWQINDHYDHVHVSNKDGNSTPTSTIEKPTTTSAEEYATDYLVKALGKVINPMLGINESKQNRILKDIQKIKNLL